MRFSGLPIPFFCAALFFTVAAPAEALFPDDFIDEDVDIGEVSSDLESRPEAGSDSAVGAEAANLAGYGSASDSWAETLIRALADHMARPGGESSAFKTGSVRTGMRYCAAGNDPFGSYWCRIRSYAGRAGITLLIEHDPGEPRALDLVSANITVPVETLRGGIVIGDFRPSYGEGLLFSRYSRSYRAGTRILNPSGGSSENASFEESRFLRGALVRTAGRRLAAETWFSRRRLDAPVDDNGHPVSLDLSGLHPTSPARIGIGETAGGAHVTAGPFRRCTLGLTGAAFRYSPALDPADDERSPGKPSGNGFQYASIDGRIGDGPRMVFFEHGVMTGGSTATVAGTLLRVERLTAAAAFRSYSREWWAPRSGAVSSFGEPSNERGVYAAVETDILSTTRLSASVDVARTISRTYASPMPVSRRKALLSLEHSFDARTRGGFVFRSTGESGGTPGRWSLTARAERGSARSGMGMVRAAAAWSAGGKTGGPWLGVGTGRKWERFGFDLAGDLFSIPGYSAAYWRFESDVPGRGMSRPVWGRGGSVTASAGFHHATLRFRAARSDLMGSTREMTLQGDIPL